MILTVFFTFSYVGCVQEEVGPASVGEDVVLGKKGDVDEYKSKLPSACNCKIQVTGISQNYSETGGYYFWRFADLTGTLDFYPNQNSSQLIINGYGSQWSNPGSGLEELPSDFLYLDPPDAGCHKFDLWLALTPVEDVILYTKVICCQGGGDCTEESATTTTYHQFVVPGGEKRVQLWKYFSCDVVSEGDEPDCAGLYGEGSF